MPIKGIGSNLSSTLRMFTHRLRQFIEPPLTGEQYSCGQNALRQLATNASIQASKPLALHDLGQPIPSGLVLPGVGVS